MLTLPAPLQSSDVLSDSTELSISHSNHNLIIPSPITPYPPDYPRPQYLTNTLQINPAVAELFLALMRPQPQCQVYMNLIDHCWTAARLFMAASLRTSCISTNVLPTTKDLPVGMTSDNRMLQHIKTDNPEYYKPEDLFHYAFGVYPFHISGSLDDEKKPTSFVVKNDRLAQWQCSKFSQWQQDKKDAGTAERKAAVHLMGLEGLQNSVLVGGYFAAVLPKRWVGREQTYLRWWQQRAAIVARITLPPSWVQIEKGEYQVGNPGTVRKWHNAPGEWELVIWQRGYIYDKSTPNSERYARDIKFAEMRWQQFIYKLPYNKTGFPEETLADMKRKIKDCVEMFRLSEWWQWSVAAYNEYIQNNSSDRVYGTATYKPHTLPKVEDTWFLDPTPENQYRIRLVPSVDHIRGRRSKQKSMHIDPIPNAVHIRVTNKIRLSAYSGTVGLKIAGLLLDMRNEIGLTKSKDNEKTWTLDEQLRKKNFSEIREELIERLEQHGLAAYMTYRDWERYKKREKWLSIQLTPVERYIPIQKQVGTSDQLSSDSRAWELIYDDIGMEATYPEIMNLWRKRFNKMQMKTVSYEGFQDTDIIVSAAKQSVLNGNVMGLGKTREALLTHIIKGGKKLLIICPAKLIGVWQDEIRDTIAPYVNRVKRHWNGSLLKCSLNIIQKANDLRPANLATFNIISYDTLKSVPSDSQFYRCPKCGVISCKKIRSDYIPTCPGNAAFPEEERCSHIVKPWRELEERTRIADYKAGRKKFKVVKDSDGFPVTFDYTTDSGEVVTRYHKVHWDYLVRTDRPELGLKTGDVWPSRVGFPEEKVMVMDTRTTMPPKPTVQQMEEVDNIHKKMKCQFDKWIVDAEGTRKKVYEWVERKPIHVGWTFADLVRRLFNHAVADESQYAANKDSQRTTALLHTRPIRSKMALTGTPVKGYPFKILPILNWFASRPIFPDYQLYDNDGTSNFLKKYQTEVTVVREAAGQEEKEEDDEVVVKRKRPANREVSKEKKIVPKINNPELFQAELAPVMVRHVRTEPNVVKCIPRKEVISHDHKVTMDEVHRAYYQLWLDAFAEWWQAKMEEEEKKSTGEGSILAKMQYLKNAATIPMYMLDNIEKSKDEQAKKWAKMIGRYDKFCKDRGVKPKATAKFIKLTGLLTEAKAAGDKSIIFCDRHANLALGERWSQKVGRGFVRVDGTVPITVRDGESRSKRHELVDYFRMNPHIDDMWAGLESMAEGMNVPEANHGFIADYGWDPTPIRQGIGRMIRPAQTKIIHAHYLFHDGTIEAYMCALCYLKGRSGDDGIDYMSFTDFTGDMVPDFRAYANAIVDGTQDFVAAKMFTAVDFLKRHSAQDDDEGSMYEGGQ